MPIRRRDLLASKKTSRGFVPAWCPLRARNKIDKIFTARVIWRGGRSHLQAVGLSHKVTRKFITIVIRPIHNTAAIYCRDIGADIATASGCVPVYESWRARAATTPRNLANVLVNSHLRS